MGKIYIENDTGAAERMIEVIAAMVKQGLTFEVRETTRYFIIEVTGGY